MPKVKKSATDNAVALTKQKSMQPGIKAVLFTANDRYGIQYLQQLNFLFANSCFICQTPLRKFSIRCTECKQAYHFCSVKCNKSQGIILSDTETSCIFCVRKKNDRTSTLTKWLTIGEHKNKQEEEAQTKSDSSKN